MAKRLAIFAYGVASYLAFFLTFVYTMGFIGNFFVERSLDGATRVALWQALMLDTALLALFAVQHSVMARPAFKRAITEVIPEAAERSTYVLFSTLALITLLAFWQPIGGTVWNIANPTVRIGLNVLCGLGFALVLVSTFLLNHFDLFGLRQVYLNLAGIPYTHLAFATPSFYKYVRHPLYVGWMIAFWAAPTMTAAHLLFAGMCTAYMLVAIRWEESDLLKAHGHKYAEYRNNVPKLIPRFATQNASETQPQRKYTAA